ncbi:MAG: CBS domain-containing protein [Bacteroidales bacterium]|nr:CBS domain-containing protein [Bacteroidales bacterium]
MLAKSLISDIIVPLRTSDSGLIALSMMEEFKVMHLPIVNERDYLGLICENDILNYNHPEDPLGNHPLSLNWPNVLENNHILEIFKTFTNNKLTLLPVIDDKNEYIGCITLMSLMENYSRIDPILNPGGIIILDMNYRDYELSEIAQIIESNDATVMGLYTDTHPNSTKMTVTIKVNKMDISGILQTLHRYNYSIEASFGENDFNDLLRDRYDGLLNFLNV